MRCSRCQGSGIYLDFGMMQQTCNCDDVEVVKPAINKESKAYRDAIAKLMKANKCSRDKAEKMFLDEFQKIA